MEYHGKNYLYNFLKEHGYTVPKRKEMKYRFFRSSEWLESYLIKAWSPLRDIIFVTVKEECDDRAIEVEYTKFVKGVIVFQKLENTRYIE